MPPNPKPTTTRLKGKDYTAFRKSVYNRASGLCETCQMPAPLTVEGVFDIFTCGHVSHIKHRGSGGGDTLDNARLECFCCHNKRNSPKYITEVA